MECLLRLRNGGLSLFRMGCGVRKRPGSASRARSLLDTMSAHFVVGSLEGPAVPSIWPRCVAPQRVRVRPAALESGWLTIAPQRGVDPVSAQRELMRMGRVANVIVFAPSRGRAAFRLTSRLLRALNPSDWNCSTTGLEGVAPGVEHLASSDAEPQSESAIALFLG